MLVISVLFGAALSRAAVTVLAIPLQQGTSILATVILAGIQQVMDLAREDTILYTNIGMGQKIDELLSKIGQKKYSMRKI